MKHKRHRTKSVIRLTGDGRAEVELTQGFVAIIDAKDVPLVVGYKWHAKVDRYTTYAAASVFVDGKGFRGLMMHRLICGLDRDDPRTPDHEDRNGLNNCRSNLKIANTTIQKLNQRIRSDNTSGVNGVHLRPDGQWQARISIAGHRMSLGNFSTAKDAIQCQEVARKIVKIMLEQVAPSLAKREAA